MPKLSPEDLAGAEVIGKLSPEDLKGAERVSKYPAPKSFTQGDEPLGLRSGPIKTVGMFSSGPNVRTEAGDGGSRVVEQDPGDLARLHAAEEGLANPITDPMQVDPILNAGMQVAFSEVGGAGTGKLIQGGKSLAPAAKALPGKLLSEPNLALMKGAIEHSMQGITGAVAKIGGEKLGAVAGAAAKVAPTIAKVAAPVFAAGSMSNAVERLRANAATNPRAAALLQKIEGNVLPEQPEFPAPVQTGTVSTGTLGGHE